jgi:hypothetical protein
MLRMQEMVLAGFKFQKFYGGGMPPNPPRKGVAFGPACWFHPKCYGQIDTLNPPLSFYKSTKTTGYNMLTIIDV